jgi:hypothetical protein
MKTRIKYILVALVPSVISFITICALKFKWIDRFLLYKGTGLHGVQFHSVFHYLILSCLLFSCIYGGIFFFMRKKIFMFVTFLIFTVLSFFHIGHLVIQSPYKIQELFFLITMRTESIKDIKIQEWMINGYEVTNLEKEYVHFEYINQGMFRKYLVGKNKYFIVYRGIDPYLFTLPEGKWINAIKK